MSQKMKNSSSKIKKTPVEILESIAGDESAPPTSRVQAARALLTFARFNKYEVHEDGPSDGVPTDELTKRALRLIKGGGK